MVDAHPAMERGAATIRITRERAENAPLRCLKTPPRLVDQAGAVGSGAPMVPSGTTTRSASGARRNVRASNPAAATAA